MAFGDRRDGKKVRGLDGMHGLMPKVKPKRCESDVYINQKFEVLKFKKFVVFIILTFFAFSLPLYKMLLYKKIHLFKVYF